MVVKTKASDPDHYEMVRAFSTLTYRNQARNLWSEFDLQQKEVSDVSSTSALVQYLNLRRYPSHVEAAAI